MITVRCTACKVDRAYGGILFTPESCPGCGTAWPGVNKLRRMAEHKAKTPWNAPGLFASRRLLKHAEGFQRCGFHLWHYKHLDFIEDREELHRIISPKRNHPHSLLHYYELAARICAYIVGEPLPDDIHHKKHAWPWIRRARAHVRSMLPMEGD